MTASTETIPAQARMGQQLGNWALGERIGVGAMGEVFSARRADGRFEGAAAVKLLHRSRLGGAQAVEVLRRFAQEQQALARLNHAHIARLLDAGESEAGEPYFVMELVIGRPITQAGALLPLAQRLSLFEQLAAAVAHAHSRLLIHRDLKPSNVLVNSDGQVKLLDFGIAKALDPMEAQLGARPNGEHHTQQDQRLFTPAFASPEQVRGEPVTTATDIYSLGILLFTLLTGQAPYGRTATTPHEAAQAVLSEAPGKPSEATPQWPPLDGTAHGVDPSLLQGDLDNIVLKALAKDPSERYTSVEAFAADVSAFLSGHPVSAQANTRWYVAKKWLARNCRLAALGVCALTLVLSAGAWALWQGQQAELAREQAQNNLDRLKSIARGVLYRVGNQIAYLPGGIEVRAKMTQALIEDLEQLAGAPDADPALQHDLAQAWARMAEMQAENDNLSLGKNESATKSGMRAIHWFERTAPTQNTSSTFAVSWAESWRAIANSARAQGDFAAALAAQDKREAILNTALQRWPNDDEVLHALGSTHLNKGQIQSFNLRQPAVAVAALNTAVGLFGRAVALRPTDSAGFHQLGTSHGALSLHHAMLGNDALALASSLAAMTQLKLATQLAPDNIAHLAAYANEAKGACDAALQLGLAPDMAPCLIPWRTYSDLIGKDPADTNWQLRRAMAAHSTGAHLASVGHQAEGLAQMTEGIAVLQRLAKTPLAKRRLAWCLVERAALSAGATAMADLTNSKATAVDSPQQPTDSRDMMMLRARWFELASRNSSNHMQAREHRISADAAYRRLHEAYGLSPMQASRWSTLKDEMPKR